VTASSPPSPPPEPLWSRLGIPALTGNGRFVSATVIDSVGTGLILAFTVVYFASTTSVSLPAIGACITLARLLALPTPLAVGPLIDRFTARRVAAAGNLVSAAGYLGFLFTHDARSVVVVVFLVQVGHTTYWTSSAGLVVLAAPEDRRTRWFGFVEALRNSGMGIGGALGAFAFALGEVGGLRVIAVANAISFLAAGTLLSGWRPARREAEGHHMAAGVAQSRGTAGAGYRAVLRDRRYAVLIGVNATLVCAQMLIKILLAVYIVEGLDRGAWLAGALIVLNTVQVALTQTVISRRLEQHRATRVVAAASLLNAAAFGLFAILAATPDWAIVGGLVVAMMVFTLGEVIGFPAIDNLSVSLAPAHIRGRYLAAYQLSWTLGEMGAPTVLIFLLARDPVLPMAFLLALSLLAVPLLMALERMMAAPDRTPAALQREPPRQVVTALPMSAHETSG